MTAANRRDSIPHGAAQAPDIRPFRSPSLHLLRQKQPRFPSRGSRAFSVRAARLHEPEPVAADDRLEARVHPERAEESAHVVARCLLCDP